MIRILPKTNIDFVGKRKIFFTISGLLVLIGLVAIFTKGLNFGLDFTGGTMMQVEFQEKVSTHQLREVLLDEGIDAEIQSFKSSNSFAIKVKGKQENVNEVGVKIKSALNKLPYQIIENKTKVEYVGPTVGKDLRKRAVMAMVFALFFIIIYIAFRFKNPIWGATGVIALLHDVFITIGIFALLQKEIDLVIVAALLTIAGFSINDTIVVFDRMRENLRLNPKTTLKNLINLSLNETLSRTIITSLTIFIAVIFVYFMGGPVLNNFAFAMLIGVVVGTYSTIAIATSLVYSWIGEGNPIIADSTPVDHTPKHLKSEKDQDYIPVESKYAKKRGKKKKKKKK